MQKNSGQTGTIINLNTLKSKSIQNIIEEDVFNYNEKLLDYLNNTGVNPDTDSQNRHLVITVKSFIT